MTTIPSPPPTATRLVSRIDRAAALGERTRICDDVKAALKDLVARDLDGIPPAFFAGAPDHYARRLLHQSPDKAYSMMVMVWQPGQSTAIHDHAGNWCVECVLRGSIEVVGYDPVGDPARICGFAETKRLQAVPGDVGILVPPNEYHTISNNGPETAITIHVYEGEMLWCHTFEEIAEGQYQRQKCDLSYTE